MSFLLEKAVVLQPAHKGAVKGDLLFLFPTTLILRDLVTVKSELGVRFRFRLGIGFRVRLRGGLEVRSEVGLGVGLGDPAGSRVQGQAWGRV